MPVRELRGNRRGQSCGSTVQVGGCLAEGLLGFIDPTELIEYQAAMDQRLHVLGVQLQGSLQLAEGPLPLAQERE
jgi:hypothetical protein